MAVALLLQPLDLSAGPRDMAHALRELWGIALPSAHTNRGEQVQLMKSHHWR